MNKRKYSSQQEKTIANNLGGRQQPNSGATPFMKGDVILPGVLIEAKTSVTRKKSYSVKEETIKKLKVEALASRRYTWALAFNFGPGTENLYVIDENTFKRIVEEK